MRLARIKLKGTTGVYHCISRVVGRQMLLTDAGKEQLVRLLHPLATFCGLEIITYCMMSNHFHLLLRVPAKVELSDSQLLERLTDFYGAQGSLTVLARDTLEKYGQIDAHLRESVMSRMGDLSAFMKEFKQQFSRWYNWHEDRFGTLWAERFKSVLVEDCPTAVRTVAAYIDLNPVRAKLVEDPKDYRFCGYTAALMGDDKLQAGLMGFLERKEWPEAAAEYRLLLFVTAAEASGSDQAVLDRQAIRSELARGGKLSLGQMLRLRLRHLTDGVILGSEKFVNEMFGRFRDRFGARRKTGARLIRGVPLPGIWVLRDLRVNAIS